MALKKTLIYILRWTGRIFLCLFVLFLGLLIYALIRETVTRHNLLSKYPPPGQMIDIGTHSIHLNCVGSGSPTVVFESDLDQLGSLSWSLVQSKVAEFARTCSYDRAGIMWSETGPRPRDGEVIASELEAVLEEAGEEGPYVMVGHAMGGAYVRIFAGRNPDAVCGMVLVDSSHPDQLLRFSAVGIEKIIPPFYLRPLVLTISHLGIARLNKGPQYSIPKGVYDAEQAFLPKSSVTWFDESVEARNILAQSGRYKSLGNMPLIVLSSARPSLINARFGDQDLQNTWLELQQELSLLSGNSELRLLKESGHYIQFDQPEVVVEAIRDICRRCTETMTSP